NPQAQELFLKLTEDAHVVVESYRPGVAKRLGIDYAAVRARSPHIVYCSISAFGQEGPLANRVAHDIAVEAQAGIASLNLGHDNKPTLPSIALADMSASLMSLSAILMALYRARETGQGDYCDMAMYDTLMAWTPNITSRVFAEGKSPDPKNERTWGGNAMYQLYETRDGRWLAIGGSEPKFARNLMTALKREDLIASCVGEPGPTQEPAKVFLRDTFKAQPLAHWETWLDGMDVCWAPVNSLKQGFDHPHTAARQMLLFDDKGNEHIGVPMKFINEPARPTLVTPGLGEHNRQISENLGFDFASLDAKGVFGN
ncbi:MAG: CaiB/BaiF CoA-transferase family protein, partial [Burkholderiaceae bacterium]